MHSKCQNISTVRRNTFSDLIMKGTLVQLINQNGNSQKNPNLVPQLMSFNPPLIWTEPQFSLPPALSGWDPAQTEYPALSKDWPWIVTYSPSWYKSWKPIAAKFGCGEPTIDADFENMSLSNLASAIELMTARWPPSSSQVFRAWFQGRARKCNLWAPIPSVYLKICFEGRC